MSIWIFDTLSHGRIAAHIANNKVAVHTPGYDKVKSELIMDMTWEQALEASQALEQVAFELRRRMHKKNPPNFEPNGICDPDIPYRYW